MAKGLFTAGNPVADILEKRRIRAQDLQNQMMQLSAQGAARPDKARLASFLGSAIGRGLAGALPDPELDKMKEEQEGIQGLQQDFANALTNGTPKQLRALANQLIQRGYTEQGSQLLAKAEVLEKAEADEAKKEAEAKETADIRVALAAQAQSLNLADLAKSINSKTISLEEASKRIQDEQLDTLKGKKSREPKLTLARKFSASPDIYAATKAGDYDNLSISEYTDLVKSGGPKADLEILQDRDGKEGTYRVDEYGRVYDEGSASWKSPVELGLSLNDKEESTTAITNAKFLFPNDKEKQQEAVEEMVNPSGATQGIVYTFMKNYNPSDYTPKSNAAFLAMVRNYQAAEDKNTVEFNTSILKPSGISSVMEKELVSSQSATLDAKYRATQAAELSKEYMTLDPVSGQAAKVAEGIKDFFGVENNVSAMRKNTTKLINEGIIQALPKGPASDTDVALVARGFPESTADPEYLASWLDAYSRVQQSLVMYNQMKSNYISSNRTSAGFLKEVAAFNKFKESGDQTIPEVILKGQIMSRYSDQGLYEKYGSYSVSQLSKKAFGFDVTMLDGVEYLND
jgi:hypothetical protein